MSVRCFEVVGYRSEEDLWKFGMGLVRDCDFFQYWDDELLGEFTNEAIEKYVELQLGEPGEFRSKAAIDKDIRKQRREARKRLKEVHDYRKFKRLEREHQQKLTRSGLLSNPEARILIRRVHNLRGRQGLSLKEICERLHQPAYRVLEFIDCMFDLSSKEYDDWQILAKEYGDPLKERRNVKP